MKSIDVGAVNVEVIVEIASGMEMTSIITKNLVGILDFKVDCDSYVIAKASNIYDWCRIELASF